MDVIRKMKNDLSSATILRNAFWYVCSIMMLAVGQHAFAAPSIFWASDPVGPGETVTIIGDGFGKDTKLDIAAAQDGVENVAVNPEIVQKSEQSVKFLVPSDFKRGMYVLRVSDGRAATDQYLNRATVYWVQGDGGAYATPGGRIRIFGRCMGALGGEPRLSLSTENRKTFIRAERADLWNASFKVPANLPSGSYRVNFTNGSGGQKGWVQAGTFEVKREEQWPKTSYNVRDYGAKADGIQNDTFSVLAAIQAAGAKGGGVVYFPRGRYRVAGTLNVPKFVTLRGERRDLVNIFWEDSTAPPLFLILGSDHFAIEDLTIYASNHQHVIGNGLGAAGKGQSGNVHIRRITVRADMYRGHPTPEDVSTRFRTSLTASSGGYDSLHLGGDDIEIIDCDIYGSGRSFYLNKPRNAYVARNYFYNGRWGWYSISGAENVIFENNEVIGADLMSTGGGINNLGDDIAESKNVFFSKNRFSLLNGWDREAVTSDAGGGYYYGTLANIAATAVSLAHSPIMSPLARGGWKGAGVFILGGRGMGQFAQVDHISGTTVYLDRPWKVLPDGKSVVTITMMQQNYIFTDNEFSDAGVAIQFYGTSVNHIVSGNKSARTAGFTNSGRFYQPYQPSWYCQFLNNDILEGNVYRSGADNAILSGEAIIGTYGYQQAPNAAPLALGTIIRGNHLHSNAHIEVRGLSRTAPGIRDVIVENNLIENADSGVLVDEGGSEVLVRGNILKNVKGAR